MRRRSRRACIARATGDASPDARRIGVQHAMSLRRWSGNARGPSVAITRVMDASGWVLGGRRAVGEAWEGHGGEGEGVEEGEDEQAGQRERTDKGQDGRRRGLAEEESADRGRERSTV